MKEKIERFRSFYSVIPTYILDDRTLTQNAKELYQEISVLINDKGYCWAGNRYFAKRFGVSQRTVIRWIKELERKDYLLVKKVIHSNGKTIKTQRKIFIQQPFLKTKDELQKEELVSLYNESDANDVYDEDFVETIEQEPQQDFDKEKPTQTHKKTRSDKNVTTDINSDYFRYKMNDVTQIYILLLILNNTNIYSIIDIRILYKLFNIKYNNIYSYSFYINNIYNNNNNNKNIKDTNNNSYSSYILNNSINDSNNNAYNDNISSYTKDINNNISNSINIYNIIECYCYASLKDLGLNCLYYSRDDMNRFFITILLNEYMKQLLLTLKFDICYCGIKRTFYSPFIDTQEPKIVYGYKAKQYLNSLPTDNEHNYDKELHIIAQMSKKIETLSYDGYLFELMTKVFLKKTKSTIEYTLNDLKQVMVEEKYSLKNKETTQTLLSSFKKTNLPLYVLYLSVQVDKNSNVDWKERTTVIDELHLDSQYYQLDTFPKHMSKEEKIKLVLGYFNFKMNTVYSLSVCNYKEIESLLEQEYEFEDFKLVINYSKNDLLDRYKEPRFIFNEEWFIKYLSKGLSQKAKSQNFVDSGYNYQRTDLSKMITGTAESIKGKF